MAKDVRRVKRLLSDDVLADLHRLGRKLVDGSEAADEEAERDEKQRIRQAASQGDNHRGSVAASAGVGLRQPDGSLRCDDGQSVDGQNADDDEVVACAVVGKGDRHKRKVSEPTRCRGLQREKRPARAAYVPAATRGHSQAD